MQREGILSYKHGIREPWRRWTTSDESTQQEGSPEETRVDQASKDLEAKDKQIAELTDTLKRVQAEFENFKKRNEKDWTERSKIATQQLMIDLLPILDSFDKAMEDAKDNGDAAEIRKGLEGLHRQFLRTLQRNGLKEICTKCKFDPFVHEALMREESKNSEDGDILEVFQKGYMLNSKAIRPARVKVARKKEEEPVDLREKEGHSASDNHIEEKPEKGEEHGD